MYSVDHFINNINTLIKNHVHQNMLGVQDPNSVEYLQSNMPDIILKYFQKFYTVKININYHGKTEIDSEPNHGKINELFTEAIAGLIESRNKSIDIAFFVVITGIKYKISILFTKIKKLYVFNLDTTYPDKITGMTQKIINYIKDEGLDGITLTKLVQKTRTITRGERREILDKLLENGNIIEHKAVTNKRPQKFYVYAHVGE